MNCQWQELLQILPDWLKHPVDKFGSSTLQELRLRVGLNPQLICKDKQYFIEQKVTTDDIKFCVNIATRYSPWTAESAAQGFITAEGGHRIGLCGDAIMIGNAMTGLSNLTSLCIRVARDFPGIAKQIAELEGSVLIIGQPGSGKTTLIRDLIRQKSIMMQTVSVIDERCEIFPKANNAFCFPIGNRIDVLSGCRKALGVVSALRSMCPDFVAVDEITAQEDCEALIQAGWCGVHLLATAHAGCVEDLRTRPVYQPILKSKLFQSVVVMRSNKTWYIERLCG